MVIATVGDLMGLKGKLINFVARHVKKIVPPFEIAGAVHFAAAIELGAGMSKPDIAVEGDDVAFLQYAGGHHRRLERRRAAAPQRRGQSRGDQGLVLAGRGPGEAGGEVCALPLYHIYALTCCALYMMRTGEAAC